MRRFAAFTAAIFLLFPAGGLRAAPDREISASEFIENFSDLLGSVPEPPAVTEAEVIELEEGDPETYIFVHGAAAHPPAPVNLGGDGRLTLTRPDAGERISAAYRNTDGTYDQGEIDKINGIMRCRLTGKEAEVSIKLLEILDAIEDRFGKRGLTLLSGYRTPKLNGRVPGAARRSLHMLGWASDIRVPGQGPDKVAEFARKLNAGGVGFYPDAAFVHLDSGRRRHWEVKRPAKPRAAGAPARAPSK